MTRRLSRLSLAVAAAGVVLLGAGCANNAPGDLSASAAKTLAPQVQRVREAAAVGDYAQLKAAVASLRSLVHQEEQAGNVSPSRANAILDAAGVLLTDARSQLSPTPTPTPTTESPTPTPTTESPTPTPTPTTESPTPTPSDTSSPVVSASVGAQSSEPTSKPKPSKQTAQRSAAAAPSP